MSSPSLSDGLGEVNHEGVTGLHFCSKGVKTTAKVYLEVSLIPIVEPLNQTLFPRKSWTFQQVSAPAHKAKATQKWLRENVPYFIASEEWPSGSPDLNPLDYKLWSVLEEIVCTKRYTNFESLKSVLVKAVNNIPSETVCTSIDEFMVRLKAFQQANGGHFE